MKGVLLLNGDPYPYKIDAENALVYCCDGAYNWAHGRVRIDKNIGDFDSINGIPDPLPDEAYPSEKDYTDGELALGRLIKAGVDEIEIYGGGGGREDHFLGNLQLLYSAYKKGVKCAMITERSKIFPASGKIALGQYAGKTFSVLPFGEALHILDFKGTKYAYPQTISYGECRGISNKVEQNCAYLVVEGVTLIIVNRGEV